MERACCQNSQIWRTIQRAALPPLWLFKGKTLHSDDCLLHQSRGAYTLVLNKPAEGKAAAVCHSSKVLAMHDSSGDRFARSLINRLRTPVLSLSPYLSNDSSVSGNGLRSCPGFALAATLRMRTDTRVVAIRRFTVWVLCDG